MVAPPRPGLTELRRGVVEFCVLALLDTADRYGLELVRTLAAMDGLVTSEGTVYPLLNRLREGGLVATDWRQTDGTRPRKYYAITADGRSALARFRADWVRFREGVDRVLAGPARPGA
ncbi:MAG TPA: PadR family transcriptional regulator [Candidatus Micrarchaeia archaeon]|nr:PadR family transcriptional regulator [Candidatus Micrarchaeia archaeon]